MSRTRYFQGSLALALSLALTLAPSSLMGQDGPTDLPVPEGALFLLLPVGAQGISLGRAMTAVPGSESAFWNPAGLAGIVESRLMVFRGNHLVGEATAVSTLFSHQPLGVFGISYQLLDVGDQDLTDSEGNVLGTINVRSHIGVASVATQLTDWLDVGVNFKVVQFNLGCRGQCPDVGVRSAGWAVDAGIQARPISGVPLRLGAMFAHLGPDFQVENADQADPLPSRIRVSVGYEVMRYFVESPDLTLWVNLEVEDRWRDPGDAPSYYVGAEFMAGQGDILFVRAGFQEGEIAQSDGFAVGVGLRYQRFEMGLAKNLAGSITGESEPVFVSFGLNF
ncbi:MAG: PorV/PorQ family protein [Gemmatimonadetes bacterium]|nr:PorV/PorQ family protein [Gemmatimonadota bacterium]